MKNKILPLFSAGIILLTGCNRGSNVSQTDPASESAEIQDSAETAETAALPDSPAGINAPDTSYSAPVTDSNGGVSLTRDRYDYLREMTDFSGRYVTLEEMGYQYVYIPEDTSRFGYVIASDGERLYFQNIEHSAEGFPLSNLTVTEYNILTGDYESTVLPITQYTVDYADRDYYVYYDGEKEILLNRASGEETILPESEKLYSRIYSDIKRIGQSFYYNITDEFSNADGSMSFESPVLCRYAPNSDFFIKLAADMKIVGSTSEEVYCGSSGGKICRYMIGGGQAEFELPYNYLYTNGAFAGYIIPATSNGLFGQRYEVGRLLPTDTWNAYQQQILTTHYGINARNIAITSASVAFAELHDHNGHTVLAMDINGSIAADTGYERILCCGNDWVYLEKYDSDSILAINTSLPVSAE